MRNGAVISSGEGMVASSWIARSVSVHQTRPLVVGKDSQQETRRTEASGRKRDLRAVHIEQSSMTIARVCHAYGAHPRLIVHRRLKELLLRDIVNDRAGDLWVFSVVRVVFWTEHVTQLFIEPQSEL